MSIFGDELSVYLDKYLDTILEMVRCATANPGGRGVLEMARRYAEDAAYFRSRGMLVEAFEAMTIAWAYVDALASLGLARVPEEFRDILAAGRVKRRS
ncbi:MAG: DUF357 domain-containing protein [Thermoplasmata archaeon]|nr:DUF357 domain-containing protein [Thermoplasmata archaeon]